MKLALFWLVIGVTCSQAQDPPEEPTRVQLEQELAAYRRVLMDWGGLAREGGGNGGLLVRKRGQDLVVFIGDEITEHWGEGKTAFFQGRPYVNRGITRQTTAQML